MAITSATRNALEISVGSRAAGDEIADAIDLNTILAAAAVVTPTGNTTHSVKFTLSDGTEVFVPGYVSAAFGN